MTPSQRAIGFAATLVITLVLITAIISEPRRQDIAVQEHLQRSINSVIDIYAHNCVECHGSTGEGFDIYPSLVSDSIRLKDPEQLYRSIERGRAGTEMAAFGIDEGGLLTGVQIEGLVDLIQHGDWGIVHARVVQLDLLPTATPTQTATPTSTITATVIPSEMPTVAASSTEIPAQTNPTETRSGMFAVVPSDTPTTDAVAPDDAPLFEVIPTEGVADNAPLFDVLSTAEDNTAPFFNIVPTLTPTHNEQ